LASTHRFWPSERGAADLFLHHRVAAVDVALHLVLQLLVVLPRVVVAAGGVDKDLAPGLAVAVAFRQQLEQRLALDLGHGVPDGHVDGADRHRALAVAARLLVPEHGGPDRVRVEVLAAGVDQVVGGRLEDVRNEALAHHAALAVAAVRVEAVAHHRLAIADDVGDDGHEAEVHLAKVDIGVADGGADGDGLLTNLDDLQR